MGWSSTGRYKMSDVKEMIVDEFKGRVLKIVNVENVIYAAIEKKDKSGVFAYIGLTEKEKNGEFYIKEMDETCGPCEANCPKSIMKILTITDNEYANNWRKKCMSKL